MRLVGHFRCTDVWQIISMSGSMSTAAAWNKTPFHERVPFETGLEIISTCGKSNGLLEAAGLVICCKVSTLTLVYAFDSGQRPGGEIRKPNERSIGA